MVHIVATSLLTFRATWEGTPPFDIWIDGRLAYSQWMENALNIEVEEPYGPPFIEVVASGESSQQSLFPYGLVLQWVRAEGVTYYRVDEFVDSAWVTRSLVPQPAGAYGQFATGALADGPTNPWRVVSLDSEMHEGQTMNVQATISRFPDAPKVVLIYDALNEDLIVSVVP